MNRDKELQRAVLAVMLGHKEEPVEEAKKPLHPNQQKLDVHEPEKDELTAKDFEMLRAGKKAKKETSQVTEQKEDNVTANVEGHKVTLHRHLSEPGESDTYTIHHPSGAKKVKISYEKHGDGSEVHGEKVNKALGLQSGHKLGHKIAGSMNGMGGISKFEESVELDTDVDETIIFHKAFEVQIKEGYNFGDYLSAAKKLVGEDQAIELANQAFKDQDESIFVEEVTRSDIEARVKAHSAAGHKVSMPKYSTRDGKPHAEYIVTDKESGVRRKYIHHGTSRKVQNMGTAGKKDEE